LVQKVKRQLTPVSQKTDKHRIWRAIKEENEREKRRTNTKKRREGDINKVMLIEQRQL